MGEVASNGNKMNFISQSSWRKQIHSISTANEYYVYITYNLCQLIKDDFAIANDPVGAGANISRVVVRSD